MPDADWFLRVGMVFVPVMLLACAGLVWVMIANREEDERDLPPAE